VKILGIDPGYAITGWSIIDSNQNIIDFGVITTEAGEKIEVRLYKIHNDLNSIISQYSPDIAAIEKLFFKQNSTTALDVSKAIGTIMLTLEIAGISFSEYSPTQVKQAVTGFGRASKIQMQTMIKTIFKIDKIPKPDDAADALAIALCHSCSKKYDSL
jgi:crossover junction endodeoxyribonuclease RuvC